jgi:hypothetical protein
VVTCIDTQAKNSFKIAKEKRILRGIRKVLRLYLTI